jgi:hypothetical protein
MTEQPRAEWPQYVELVGLHKFYFEYLIKAGGFSLGILGAIIAFTITEKLPDDLAQIALALPLVLSLASGLIFGLAIPKTLDLKRQVDGMQHRLGLAWRPHVEILVWMSWVFTIVFFGAAAGVLLLMLNLPGA